MERHLSVGVSTLVALMAAHRAVAKRPENRPPGLDQNEYDRIAASLRGNQARTSGCRRADGWYARAAHREDRQP